jgi:predicted N-acetyltransferase YhbS
VIREERPGDRAPVREVEIAIGTALMHGGLARITGPVVLLGHPAYYTRFGFRPAFPSASRTNGASRGRSG